MADKDFNIRINTVAQLQGAQQAQKQLEESIKTTKALGLDTKALEAQLARIDTALKSEAVSALSAATALKQVIEHTKNLGGDTSGLESALARVEEKIGRPNNFLNRVNDRFEAIKQAYHEKGGGLAGVINAFGARQLAAMSAFAAATAAAFTVAKKSVTEFAESEEKVLSLDQAVANQGRLTQAYADELRDLASAFEKTTAVAASEWLGVLEQLTKHGANASNIHEYAEAVKNLAGLIGGDVASAAQIFSQAMAGSYEGLRRNGIAIKENVDASEQLQDIMRQLSERGAGILETRAKSLNGEWRGMKIALSNLLESFGGFIARTQVLQSSMELTTWWLRKLTNLIPEFHHNIDTVTNKLPVMSQGLTEAGAAAAGSVDGILSAQSAVDKLKGSYDAARDSAEEFRHQQDQLDDAQLQNQLAFIDNQEAKGLISSGDARVARAGFRMSANERRLKREQASIQEEEDRLRGEQNAAFNKYDSATSTAANKGAHRDRLIDEAKRYFGLESDQAIELKRIQAQLSGGGLGEDDRRLKETRRDQLNGILAAGKGLTYGDGVKEALARAEADFQQAQVASRNDPIVAGQLGMRRQRLAILNELPQAIKDAAAAEAAAGAAKTNYNNVFGQTSPRREADAARLTELEFERRRNQLQNETEVFNTYRDRERNGMGSGFQGVVRGGGFGNFGAEMQENTRSIDGFGKQAVQILQQQNSILEKHRNDLRRIEEKMRYMQMQADNNRNW